MCVVKDYITINFVMNTLNKNNILKAILEFKNKKICHSPY